MADEPTLEKAIAALDERLNAKLGYYSRLRGWVYASLRRYKWLIALLAMSSTIVLGLDLGEESTTTQKNIGLVIGALVTLFSTMLAYWNLEEYWMHNTVMTEALAVLKERLELEKNAGLTMEGLKELFKEYQNILGQHQTYWKGAMEKGTDNGTDKGARNT